MIKYFILFLTLIVIYTFGRFFYLKYVFQDIEIPVSTNVLIRRLGKPNIVHPTFGKKNTDWIYFQYPIPEEFVFEVQGEIVIEKINSISP